MNYPLRVENVRKIAVLRANAIGDFIVTLPALLALKQTYPAAELVLLGAPWHKQFLKPYRCSVDRVEIVPEIRGIREDGVAADPEDVNDFIRRMQQESFDLMINLQGAGIASNPVLKACKPSMVIGPAGAGAEMIDRSVPYFYAQHEVMRFLEIVRLVGATTDSYEPCLEVLDSDWQELSESGLNIQFEKYVVINPVARDRRRMWPVENYNRVIEALLDLNFDVVLTGAAADSDIIDDLLPGDQRVHNCCGLSLDALTALCSRASLFIGPDTGPLHLAQAVHCPTIGFFWAPNALNWAPLNRHIHRPLISWNMTCPYCGIIPNDPHPFEPRSSCQHDVSFVRDIPIETVLDALTQLLARDEMNIKTTEEIIN